MALKLSYKLESEIPEHARSEYVEKEGMFVLDLTDAVVPKEKLDEFRTNNIKYKQEIEKLSASLKNFDGVDPVKYKEITAKIQDLEDKKMIDAGKLDELLASKTDKMKKDYDGQIDALKKAVDEKSIKAMELENHLSKVLIDTEITKAVSAAGIPRQGAMVDILNRGREVWKLVDGIPTPMKGDTVIYSKDGKNIISFTEWAVDLTKEAEYLFEPSKGAGGIGNTGSAPKFGQNKALADLPATERLKAIYKTGAAK